MRSNLNDKSSASPRVSIGMPVYNGEEHVREAIESILAQTFTDFELIIADNCSEDRTESICREYADKDPRVRYYRRQCNLGLCKNFTFVFEQSRGEYFRWAAHDDVIAPTYVQRCVEMLDQCGPNVVLCYPRRLLMTYDGQILGPNRYVHWIEAGPPFDRISFARLMRVNPYNYPIFCFGLMRREVLAKTKLIAPYRTSDLMLIAEMRLLGEFREIAEPLFYTRLHQITAAFRKQRGTLTAEAEWMDPSNIGKKPWPELTLFYERLRSVHRFGGAWYKKTWYYAWVIYGHLVVRSPQLVCEQIREMAEPIWPWWERVSAVWVRRSGNNYFPLRVWTLLSGLRNRDKEKLTLAFARAAPHTEKALVEFVARKLSKRHDPYARELLHDWLNGSCPVRKSAAERAMNLSACRDHVVSKGSCLNHATSPDLIHNSF